MIEVKRLLAAVNSVFAQVDILSSDEFLKMVWDECVMGRGYYVVGAYMCQVIEEKSGKAALIETLTISPVAFIKLFNSLVSEEMKIQLELLEAAT